MAGSSEIKVLHIGASSEKGGIEAFILNVCSHLEQGKYRFSITADCKSAAIEQEFRQLGGEVLYIPSAVSHKLGYILALWKLIDAERFDVVHIHKNSLANPAALYICKLKRIRTVILHSHNTQPTRGRISAQLHAFFKNCIKGFHVVRLACSQKAAEWMFPEGQPYALLHNGIDLHTYRYRPETRTETRKALGIPEQTYAFCAVGRLTAQKNPLCVIDIFKAVKQRHPDSRLFMIGSGDLEAQVKNYAAESGLQQDIVFLGVRNDIPALLQGMDLMLMPSLYEGLPVAAVEAQAAGLPLLISENVDQEVIMLASTEYEDVRKSADVWAAHALDLLDTAARKDVSDSIRKAGYDIIDTAGKIEQIYLQ